MQAEGEKWKTELRSHIAGLRVDHLLPDRQQLDPAEEWQCRIVGGALLTWLREIGPNVLQERQVMSQLLGIEPDPMIVFTTNRPGLVAASQIVTPETESVLVLDHEAFIDWSQQHPDEEYRWHVHAWSFIRTSPDQKFLVQAQQEYPLDDERATYWEHTEGTMWARQAGRGVDHLWKWDGDEPGLLEEAFHHWVC